MVRRILRALAVMVLSGAAVPVVVVGTVFASLLFLPLPATPPGKPVNPALGGLITRVYASDGTEIGQFREYELNIPVRKEDIPAVLKQAVVSAEDRNFYRHGGVDARGTVRALWADLRGQRVSQGGSTITQQYVKNAYTNKQRTVTRKLREAILASQLDRAVDKDEILFKYLSTVYLGEGAFGVGAAAQTYFRKSVRDLDVSEAALLAGLIPAPSRYEPRGNVMLAESKREVVLRKMLDQRYITQQQYDEAFPRVVFNVNGDPPPPAATLVYPPEDPVSRYPYFLDYVKRYLVDEYGPDKVIRGGLQVQTTLDPALEDAAMASVARGLGRSKPPLDMALASVEPQTGFVKSLVGGRDFGANQVNLALGHCPAEPGPDIPVEVPAACWSGEQAGLEGGGTGRQPGSSFKLFTLLTALEQGISPETVFPAPREFRVPGCTGKQCVIGNAEGEGGGSATLRRATALSINTVFAQLILKVGIKNTAETAKKMGITSAWYSPRVHGASYTLGTQEVAPLEMASAYGVVDNHGVRQAPTPVAIVKDQTGKIIEDNTKRTGTRVIDAAVADNATDILRGVIDYGTGTGANLGRPAAGKTGTGQNYTNAWFVGYTPTLSTACWMGFSTGNVPMKGILGKPRIYGGTICAPVWKDFMSQALKSVPVTDFTQPAPIERVRDRLKKASSATSIAPGPRRRIDVIDGGGPYVAAPPAARATAPTTTSTTSTTSVFGGGGGGGGSGGDSGGGSP